MATKISGMTAGAAMDNTETFEAVQGGNTRKLTGAQIATGVLGVGLNAQSAASALAGTEKIAAYQSGGKYVTPAQLKTYLAGIQPGTFIGGRLIGADMNSTADQAIPITMPAGVTKYRVTAILVCNASVSLSTCQGGVYGAAAKSAPIVSGTAATLSYAALTATAINTNANMLAPGVLSMIVDYATLYLSLTTPQGAPATADFYIHAQPVF